MTPAPDPALPDAITLREKKRAAWAGVWLNAPLSLGKILGGIMAQSQALIADGVHSLSDLASDAAVLWALGHSHRPPDDEHPFGHGRFETLATLAVAAMLALAAGGIVIDAALRLIDPPESAPAALALWIALGSTLFKEALFHYTNRVARRTGSAMMSANAWHHRSDALSSVVALAGIGMSMAGWPIMDALAALIIAFMLVRLAWRFGHPAVAELVDEAPGETLAQTVLDALAATPGVRDVHDLRLRRLGGTVQADVHLGLDPDLTLSEAHRLCEAARGQVRAFVPELAEIVIHPEPHGHADGFGAHGAALRPVVRATVEACLHGLVPPGAIVALHLDYRNDGIRASVIIEQGLDAPAMTEARARLARMRRARSTDLVSMRFLGPIG